MTDLDKFKELYESVGIKLTEATYPNGTSTLTLGVDRNKKFGGDINVYSDIEFDQDGKFICQNFFD